MYKSLLQFQYARIARLVNFIGHLRNALTENWRPIHIAAKPIKSLQRAQVMHEQLLDSLYKQSAHGFHIELIVHTHDDVHTHLQVVALGRLGYG